MREEEKMNTSIDYWINILNVAEDVIKNLHLKGYLNIQPEDIEEAKYQLEKIEFWISQLKKIYRKK